MKQFKGYLLILALTSAGAHSCERLRSYSLTLLSKKFFNTSVTQHTIPTSIPRHYFQFLFNQAFCQSDTAAYFQHSLHTSPHEINEPDVETSAPWRMTDTTDSLHNGHTHIITTIIRLSENSLASASRDGSIIIWQLNDHDRLSIKEKINTTAHLHAHTDGITSLCSTHQTVILSGSYDHTIAVWQKVRNGNWLLSQRLGKPGNRCIYDGHTSLINGIIALDEQTIASCDQTGIIIWQESHDGQWHMTQQLNQEDNVNPNEGHTDRITCIKKIDQKTFATGSYDNTVLVWHEQHHGAWIPHERIGQVHNFVPNHGHIRYIIDLCALDKDHIITTAADDALIMWKRNQDGTWLIQQFMQSPTPATFTGNTRTITSLTATDAHEIISTSWDHTALVWQKNDNNSWQIHERIGSINNTDVQRGHTNVITSLCKPNERTLATGSWDHSLIIWKKDDV